MRTPLSNRVRTRTSPRGFSLIELLLVILIMIVLFGITGPAITSVLRGNDLNRAGWSFGDRLMLARQEALTKNCNVEVRFYKLPSGWSAVQLWRVAPSQDGSTPVPVALGSLVKAPSSVIIDEQLSPLLNADSTIAGTADLPYYHTVKYAGFRFRPNGSVSTVINSSNNYITFKIASDPTEPPANNYTIQVDPVTGKIITFQP
ncbi:MAG: Verru_Chthon cassette protein D [Chthoniobacteraceae bacterium]